MWTPAVGFVGYQRAVTMAAQAGPSSTQEQVVLGRGSLCRLCPGPGGEGIIYRQAPAKTAPHYTLD